VENCSAAHLCSAGGSGSPLVIILMLSGRRFTISNNMQPVLKFKINVRFFGVAVPLSILYPID
jgi:hypothetical protein